METETPTQSISRRNLYIYILLWSFISGVLLSSFIIISPVFSVLLIMLSGVISLVAKLEAPREAGAKWGKIPKETIFIIIVLFAFGLGSLRYAVKDFHELLVPSREGMVASEPERRDTDTRFVFRADNGEQVLVSTDMYTHIEYGDRVQVSGKLERPGVIVDQDSGRAFDYGAYLAKDDTYYTMNFARVEIVAGQSQSIMFRRFLFGIKNAFVQKMKVILPEPESSLLAGLIVAGKQALPKVVLNDFKNAGVVHIVVLSGYNITIVAEFFLVLLAFLSLRKRTLVALVGIILFVLMAGASASIIRAGIMALIVLLGKVIHRRYSAPRTLLFAAALMLVQNPKLLVFDPSFQLTFLAMLALIYVEPIVSVWLNRMFYAKRRTWVETLGINTLLSTSIATQVVVLPYLLYSAGSVSIVSLLSNILILVFIPFTMLVGFIATMLAFITPYLALPFTFISHVLLVWILGVAHTLGNLSFANVRVNHVSVWLVVLLYVVMGMGVWRLRSSPTSGPSKNSPQPIAN